jgi:hypothetical protein
MGERDQLEQDLRIEQMTVNIEKLRQDIRLDQQKARQDADKMRLEIKWETRKFMLQSVIALAAAVAAGVALGRFLFGN